MTIKNLEETEQEQVITVATRFQATLYDLKELMSTHFPKIYQLITGNGRKVMNQPYSLYRMFDDNLVDIELGMQVDQKFELSEPYRFSSFPTGKVVKAEFYGPYSKISEGYEKLSKWAKDKGLQTILPNWEIYVSDPMNTPDLNDLGTDIHMKIAS